MAFRETVGFTLKSDLILSDANIQQTCYLGRKRKGQICNTLSTLQNGIPKKLGSGRMVWTLTLRTLRPLDFELLDSRHLDDWILEAWMLGLWTPEPLENRLTFRNYMFATKVI